jgi:hypothetical protein
MPSITDKILPVMEYMDAQREFRTGMSRAGQGLDPETLQNQSATMGALQFTAAQAMMKMIARIMAETGIRDMFSLLHETIRKHASEQSVFRLRNKWVNVDPRQWKRRDDMTINVGLGGGGKAEQVAFAQGVLTVQQQALLGGKSNLVSDTNLYNAATELCKAMGHKDGDRFFTDPTTVPPPQAPPNPEMIKAQAQMQQIQLKAQLDDNKAKNDVIHQQAKNAAELELDRQKMMFDMELAAFKAKVDADMKEREMAHKTQLANMDFAHKQRMSEFETQHQARMNEFETQNRAAQKPQTAVEVKHDTAVHQAIAELGKHIADSHTAMVKHLTAPKRIVRDKNGKASHVETVQ